MEASYTPQLSYGYYSPYIASVLDIVRIFGSFATARYQYIPALATQRGEVVALTLNTPPSFHDPKSVLVTALPAVEAPQPPPLHAVDPKEIYCARKSSLVLPVEGAPLVFSTGYAHDLRLSLTGSDGKTIDLPVRADAEQGGFVVDTSGIGAASLGDIGARGVARILGIRALRRAGVPAGERARGDLAAGRRRERGDRRARGHRAPAGEQRELHRSHHGARPGRQGAADRVEAVAPQRGGGEPAVAERAARSS